MSSVELALLPLQNPVWFWQARQGSLGRQLVCGQGLSDSGHLVRDTHCPAGKDFLSQEILETKHRHWAFPPQTYINKQEGSLRDTVTLAKLMSYQGETQT